MSAKPSSLRWQLLSLTLSAACASSTPKPQAVAPEVLIVDAPQQRAARPASPLVKEAEALYAKGDVEAAFAKFEEAARDTGDARAQLGLGLSAEALQKLDVAERAYRKAGELDPSLAEAHNNLGLLLRERGDLEGGLQALTRAAEADPSLPSAQANLALALEDAGRADEAAGAYKKAVALAGSDPMLRANYGLFLLNQGQREAAVEQLLAGLSRAKGDRAALLALGNGLRRAQKPDVAVRALREAIAGGDGKPSPALLSELSLAQHAAGDGAGAKVSLEEALRIAPKYATAHYLLGSLLAGEGNFKAAAQHYKRCIELEPQGDLSRKAREKLQAATDAAKRH